MKSITATQNVINIGYQGENNAACVQFNVSGWKELYGEGSYTLLVKRNGDPAAYPVSVQSTDTTVTWIVSSGDTAAGGNGSAELVYTVDGTIAKSVIYRTTVMPSLDGSAEPPQPWESWVQEVLEASADAVEAAQNAETAAEKAEAAVVHSPIISGGTWWIWSQPDEEYVDTEQPARGERGLPGAPGAPGADGFSPTATVEQTADGSVVSITDKNGTTTAYIYNGAPGAPGADGAGIASIEKTGTAGLVDTYTITLTNGNTATFTVTNGSSIASITKTATEGLVDTYTVTLTDGSTTNFTVTNGKDGASSILDSVLWRPAKNFGAVVNGVVGDNVKVYRDWADERLVFVGSGEMYSGTAYNDPYIAECILGFGNTTINEIYIQDGITSIGFHIFNRFYSASNTSAYNVKSFSASSFTGVGFVRKTLVIPKTVTSIGFRAFQYFLANFIDIRVLTDDALLINQGAFEGSKIETITIPNATRIFGYNAVTFSIATLKNFSVGGTLEDSITFTSTVLTDDSLVNIGNHLDLITGTQTTKTLTLSSAMKTRLSAIMGTVADNQFTVVSGGTVSLQDFITNTRGWTVA